MRDFEDGKYLMSELYKATLSQGLAGNRQQKDKLILQYREYMSGLTSVSDAFKQAYDQYNNMITRNGRDVLSKEDEVYAANDLSENSDKMSQFTLAQ